MDTDDHATVVCENATHFTTMYTSGFDFACKPIDIPTAYFKHHSLPPVLLAMSLIKVSKVNRVTYTSALTLSKPCLILNLEYILVHACA